MNEIFSIDSIEGIVQVGDVQLPGLLQRFSIGCDVIVDKIKPEGKSGSNKQAQGFEDATVDITILLVDTADNPSTDQMKLIDGMFKGVDATAKPQIYRIVHPLAQARNMKKVLFSSLKSDMSRKDKKDINVTLKFEEFDPPVIKVQSRAPGANAGKDGTKKTEDKGLDGKEPANKGFFQGLADGIKASQK